MNNMQRNPFFLPSGFEPQEIINILEGTKENRERLNKIRIRRRAEKKSQKKRLYATNVSIKKSKKSGQIQHGYDLAKKWGWDGINRPYTPKIMSVFGGRKRKHG